ncbi:aminoglycoside phosphotransferase family protein [Exiguobacterium artemiae]|uniref:aminoglycoside phosphotransferase family protein n=1 Tax=Exiguobacterium artemiae TaxID=340145 RepID=UPI00047D6781|nr:aminoglycoside phosphotransferase family protein [Exiguobacterium sibiricum]
MDVWLQLLQAEPELRPLTDWSRLATRYTDSPKYTACDESGLSIIHTAPLGLFARKKREFELLRQLYQDGLPVPEPLNLNRIPPADVCYSRYRFLTGSTIRNRLPLGRDIEYRLGRETGRVLNRIHRYEVPPRTTWAHRCRVKHNRYVALYQQEAIPLAGDQAILSFIERNIGWIADRPNRWQHDDIHLANLITDGEHLIGMIDFSNHDIGDPWHDFVKMGLFQVEESIPFAVGQVDGYFEGDVPEQFWDVYSVYLAMSCFSSIVWTNRHAPEEADQMRCRLERVISAHQRFERAVPDWYETFDRS